MSGQVTPLISVSQWLLISWGIRPAWSIRTNMIWVPLLLIAPCLLFSSPCTISSRTATVGRSRHSPSHLTIPLTCLTYLTPTVWSNDTWIGRPSWSAFWKSNTSLAVFRRIYELPYFWITLLFVSFKKQQITYMFVVSLPIRM